MTREEHADYVGRAVEGYAEAMVRAGRIDADNAHDLSVASFERIMPDGYDTVGQVLLVAEDAATGERVGILWFGPSADDEHRAWIYDIEVDEARRGQGWGRATMAAFEPAARERGFTSAGLNVYGDNVVARRLYETMGYTETSRQMAKSL
jgi:ribosomal protein S18 acetylase RimI-like enzyme